MKGTYLVLLMSLLVVTPSHSRDEKEEPWLDRVQITSDPSEVEECTQRGEVQVKIKKKKSKDFNIGRLKRAGWGRWADIVLLTEESWGEKLLTGEVFRCLIVHSVTNRSDVEGCRFISKIHKSRGTTFSELMDPGKNPTNPVTVGQLERLVWEKGGDTLFVIHVGTDSGSGEAYVCEARQEKESN